MNNPVSKSEQLANILRSYEASAIAVSGGVDSMTLASYAHRILGRDKVRMIHALSPAVPLAATARVRAQSEMEGWRLDIVDAGEFDDAQYRANPVNRCFYCKTNLYETCNAMTEGVVLSGTNCDDLGDYRPGLEAAVNNSVHHPYVEAGLAKQDVRRLADFLGLPELAELPSSPCLSSRVETGIPIDPKTLRLIDEVESWLQTKLSPKTVRCRIRPSGMALELDPNTINRLGPDGVENLSMAIQARFLEDSDMNVEVEPYIRGSAFIGANFKPEISPGTLRQK